MAEPMILELLDNLKVRVATNETNIATNAADIATNKQLFDTHTADDNRHWTTTDRENFDRVVHFKGYYSSINALKTAYPTAQLGDYAIVGETDTVWAWDDTTNSWLNTTEQGIVISVNGRTGEVILTKTDVGLSNVDNTSDANKPISTAQQTALNTKADRKKITASDVDGMALRAGVYDLYGVERTISGYSSSYWTVIVGEDSNNSNKSSSQLWIDYATAGQQHIFVRKQNGSAWGEFIEILTSNHLTTINNTLDDIKEDVQNNADDITTLESDKADRKVITAAQVDSLDLRAGVYYLNNVSRTINGFTAAYWNVIVGETVGGKGATQTWINYNSNSVIHMYVRRQQNNNSWSDFTEVLTSTQLTTINQAISAEETARKNADDTLNKSKADRKSVTLTEADDCTALRSGIYHLDNTSKTILGYTDTYWTIIVGELGADYGATQIWIPVGSNTANLMFIRHQKMSESTRIWGDFSKILTNADFTTLQTQITTNATNIATNTTDITDLKNNKADRGNISLAQADALDLKAGIYGINNQSKTILGFTSSYWNVYVASNPTNNNKSGSQIWFNIVTGEVPHMYIRHQQSSSTSWSNFYEIYTTNQITTAELSRFKQYKGYFATLSDLQTAYATATAGDYAIVGNSIFIWDTNSTKWMQASGSGSTGINKWSIRRFDGTSTRIIPQMSYIVGSTLEKQWEVDDTENALLNETTVDNKFFLIETFVNMQKDTDVTTSALQHDDGVNIYVNGESIYSTAGTVSGTTITLSLKQGWNKIQFLLQEISYNEIFKLGVKISSNTDCIQMDCYHAETDLIQGYVPLKGDSTIDGNITITGDLTGQKNITAAQNITATGDLKAGGVVKITDSSYLQYNESDKSLSFMFN